MSTDKSLTALLKRLKRTYPDAEHTPREPMEEFVFSFLTWEASGQRAEHAIKRMLDGTLDLNELRVTRPEDLAAVMGKTYPNVEERAERLHLALNDLYKREHAVSLERVLALSKRDGRKFIEDLDGMVPYVSARIALLALDTHAIPIDERTLELLIEEGVVEEGATIEKAVGKLERHIKSTDAIEAHLLLQRWAEDESGGGTPRKRSARAGGTRTAKRSGSRRKTAAK